MRLSFLIPVVVIVLDQFSKGLVLHMLRPYESIPYGPFLNWVLVFNTGVSFGLFAGHSVFLRWIFVTLAIVVSFWLAVWLYREKRGPFCVALGCIIGGALSNALDRTLRYGVVDFIDLHLGGWHWPAFNLADSAITFGVALYILLSLRDHNRSSKL